MKRTSVVLALCCALLALPHGIAAQELPDLDGASFSAPDLSAYHANEKSIESVRRGGLTAFTSDIVTIDEENGVYTVNTDSVGMRVEVPFGYVCITQDIFQQLDVYFSLYKDVSVALQDYIENGVHLNLFDLLTGLDVYVYVEDDPLSALVGDLAAVPEAYAQRVFAYMAQNWFDDAQYDVRNIGSRPYAVVDLREDHGYITYITFAGGKTVQAVCFADADDEDALSGVASLMECVSVTTLG